MIAVVVLSAGWVARILGIRRLDGRWQVPGSKAWQRQRGEARAVQARVIATDRTIARALDAGLWPEQVAAMLQVPVSRVERVIAVGAR